MKKLIIPVVMVTALLAGLLLSGCQTILVPQNGETETGSTETRQYDLSEFTRVEISSAFTYEIRQADAYGISITANSNMFEDIRVTKEGETLIIELEVVPWAVFSFSPTLKAVIAMPQLQGLESSGATHGTVTGFSSPGNLDITASGASSMELSEISAGEVRLEASGASSMELSEISADEVSLDASGASEITGDITAQNLELEVSGASEVRLEGSTGSIMANASGASDLKLADLKAVNADINLSGASNGTVNLDGTLDVELSGASSLEYLGRPDIGRSSITGGSELENLD